MQGCNGQPPARTGTSSVLMAEGQSSPSNEGQLAASSNQRLLALHGLVTAEADRVELEWIVLPTQ